MASILDIYNMALRHVGVSVLVTSLTERSKNANACNLFYPNVRDEVLRDAPWPFATTFELLALVEEDPTSEWLFSYRHPSSCITFRRLLDTLQMQQITMFNSDIGLRRPVILQFPHINFRIGRDSVGLLVYSSQEGPLYCEYTKQITDPNQFPPDVTQAIALKMAGYLAPSVSGGDQLKLGERALQLYAMAIARAKQNAGNEAQMDLDSYTSELEQARS